MTDGISNRGTSQEARNMTPTDIVFDTSLDLDNDLPENFKAMTRKFELMDPDIYRRINRIRTNSLSSSRQRPETTELDENTRPFDNQIEQQPAQESVRFQSNEQRAQQIHYAIDIVSRFLFRRITTLFRHSFTNIIIMGVNRLKNVLTKVQRQSSQPAWQYEKLYKKANPTEQEQMFKDFLSHCATRIQCNWRAYITHKRHKQAMAVIHKLRALLKGWKVRQICKSARLKQLSQNIRDINQAIQHCQMDFKLQKQMHFLYKQQELNVNIYNEQFEMLYETGGWVFERNLSRLKQKQTFKSVSNYQTNYKTVESQESQPVRNEPKKRKRQFANEKAKNTTMDNSQIQNYSALTQNTLPGDERPIKSTGKYIIDMETTNVTVELPPEPEKKKIVKKPSKIKKNQPVPAPVQSVQSVPQPVPDLVQEPEHAKQPVRPNVKRLVRKQRYDPRKAIEEEKKRKAEQVKKQQQVMKQSVGLEVRNASSLIDMHQKQPQKKLNRKRSQKPEKLEKPVAKKAQPKVQCWSKRVDSVKQQRQKNYYSQNTEDIAVDPQPYFNPYRLSIPESDMQQSKLSPIDVNFTEHFKDMDVEISEIQKPMKKLSQQRHEKFTKNLQRIIQQLEQRREERRKGYKSVEQLMETYEGQYMNRYKKLAPKMEKLFFQRSQETYPLVPIILHSSMFGQTVSNYLDWHSYRRIQAKLEKQHKAILEEAQ